MESQKNKYWLHILLFILTVLTTTFSGAELMFGKLSYFTQFLFEVPQDAILSTDQLWQGLHYSIPFLAILTVHEFGHYFTAKYYQLRVSLPFYIPMWLGFLGFGLSIGTMGAFIQIKSQMQSNKEFFDVGIAGPLAGFVVAIAILFYGFTNLPPAEYIFTIHPEYKIYGLDYAQFVYKNMEGQTRLGTNLLFEFFKNYVADPKLLPHDNEMMHYPYLLAGYFALFFTALNLMPIGQLDGGHILYGLLGYKKHKIISFVLLTIFVFYAGLGLFRPIDELNYLAYAPVYITFLYFLFSRVFESKISNLLTALSVFALQFTVSYFFPNLQGYHDWLLFAFILGKVLGISHPVAEIEKPLDWKRQVLGWISLLIFILSFTPQVIVLE